jgi:hypothetical protein
MGADGTFLAHQQNEAWLADYMNVTFSHYHSDMGKENQQIEKKGKDKPKQKSSPLPNDSVLAGVKPFEMDLDVFALPFPA